MIEATQTAISHPEVAKITSPSGVELFRKELQSRLDPNAPLVIVCCGTGCQAAGSADVVDKFKQMLSGTDWNGKVIPLVKPTGCHGFCSRGPLVIIEPQDLFYQQVTVDDVEEIVNKTILNNEVIKKLQYKPANSKEVIPRASDIPYYAKQTRLVLKNIGKVDPTEINDSIVRGSYSALASVLTRMSPQQVIDEVANSKLRGRGGAGFPTGLKWESCARQEGTRYVICNADEGDPGAFMDRSLLEGDPHSVLEGMAICAYAVGSNRGYMYVRAEYPLAVKTLNIAIRQAEALGLLGENIMGTGFDFKVTISTGAGAFICGESSALMASLEGKVGRPRPKYIRSVEKGFRDSPSNLNNVETYANIPDIITNGGDWYKSFGTERSSGTKVFALTGNVYNIGLVEVPMGISLMEIVFGIGGGIPNKRALKGVQTGGPSGGCIPIPHKISDINVGYGKLAEAGSIMGSGGMIVMDEDTCMIEVSRYFVNFLVEESCGQCTPCREGLIRMREILNRITQGEGREGDVELLTEIGNFTNNFSLCGLGTSAANPVLSTIRYFREEYDAHIRDKKCPSGVCKPLFHYDIDAETCTGCGLCKIKCPVKAITGEKKKTHVIEQSLCIKCMECYKNCKFRSVKIM
ncbi:MAG: NADH-ubiquinone oxidoreductase-F iron-sulfur binding region domain-containing protein [Deltaproteobacteria bacterium]|jgi:NADH:ubiquinone oxidoreductase subunit F (NADH-binding)/(2Fe-2S) ferredoxin